MRRINEKAPAGIAGSGPFVPAASAAFAMPQSVDAFRGVGNGVTAGLSAASEALATAAAIQTRMARRADEISLAKLGAEAERLAAENDREFATALPDEKLLASIPDRRAAMQDRLRDFSETLAFSNGGLELAKARIEILAGNLDVHLRNQFTRRQIDYCTTEYSQDLASAVNAGNVEAALSARKQLLSIGVQPRRSEADTVSEAFANKMCADADTLSAADLNANIGRWKKQISTGAVSFVFLSDDGKNRYSVKKEDLSAVLKYAQNRMRELDFDAQQNFLFQLETGTAPAKETLEKQYESGELDLARYRWFVNTKDQFARRKAEATAKFNALERAEQERARKAAAQEFQDAKELALYRLDRETFSADPDENAAQTEQWLKFADFRFGGRSPKDALELRKAVRAKAEAALGKSSPAPDPFKTDDGKMVADWIDAQLRHGGFVYEDDENGFEYAGRYVEFVRAAKTLLKKGTGSTEVLKVLEELRRKQAEGLVGSFFTPSGNVIDPFRRTYDSRTPEGKKLLRNSIGFWDRSAGMEAGRTEEEIARENLEEKGYYDLADATEIVNVEGKNYYRMPDGRMIPVEE